MANERTYPYEWFYVSARWGDIRSKVFLGETKKMLRDRMGLEGKSGKYGTWYPDREQAESASKVILERVKARRALEFVRNAAPEMLEALEELFSSYKQLVDSGGAGNWVLEDEPEGQKAMAAIAKARGK